MAADPLTILQILPALRSGGVERGVVEVAQAVAEAGYRSLVMSAGGPMVADIERAGAHHIACPLGIKSPLTLRWIPWLRQFLIRRQVDVMDVHSRLPAWMASIAWKSLAPALRPRLVSTFHGLHSVSWYSRIMCCGERIVVVSRTMREHVLEHYPQVDPARLVLIPRGVDPREFPRGYQPDPAWLSNLYQQFPQLRDQALVTLPGRISRLKGHLDFLHVLSQLKQQGVPVHGVIAGAADRSRSRYFDDLQDEMRKQHLTSDITFIGHCSDIRQLYSISRAVVSLSRQPESFGRTVAEALSMGIPVVGYAHGGVGEILQSQFPAGAVEPGDISDVAQKLGEILTGRRSVEVSPGSFHRNEMLEATLSLYRELAASRQRAAA